MHIQPAVIIIHSSKLATPEDKIIIVIEEENL